MTVLYDIIIGVVSSLAYFVLGVIAHKLLMRTRERSRGIVWGLFEKKQKLGIKMSIRQGPKVTSTPRVSIAEVSALTELIPALKMTGQEFELTVEPSDYVLKHYNNILAIGGTKANDVTKNVYENYKHIWPVRIKEDAGFEVGARLYSPVYSDDGTKLLTDYGLVALIKEKNRDKVEKTVMLVMGYRGYGTEGAVKCLQSKEFAKIYNRYKKPSKFMAIVKVDFGEETETKIVEFFPLLTK